jgi:hypothetical protein
MAPDNIIISYRIGNESLDRLYSIRITFFFQSSSASYVLQATIAPPVKGKMFKGICVCYAVIVSTYFSVGISGYWASGNQAQPTILTNFMGDGKPLLPTVNQLLHSYAIGCYHSSTSFPWIWNWNDNDNVRNKSSSHRNEVSKDVPLKGICLIKLLDASMNVVL